MVVVVEFGLGGRLDRFANIYGFIKGRWKGFGYGYCEWRDWIWPVGWVGMWGVYGECVNDKKGRSKKLIPSEEVFYYCKYQP